MPSTTRCHGLCVWPNAITSPALAPAASAILGQNDVRPILGPVRDVVERRAVHEHERRSGDVAAERAEVESKRKRAEKRLRLRRHVRARPRVAHVRQLFLSRILVAAAAVLVVGRDRRVVVAGDALRFRASRSRATTSFGHGAYPTRSPR